MEQDPPKTTNPNASDQRGVGAEMDHLKTIMYAVLIVLGVGFIGALIAVGAMLQSYLASRQATFEDLKDKVLEQNVRMEVLINQVTESLNKKK